LNLKKYKLQYYGSDDRNAPLYILHQILFGKRNMFILGLLTIALFNNKLKCNTLFL